MPYELSRRLAAGPVPLGANRSVGSSTLYEVLAQMQTEVTNSLLCIQPNAGLPSPIGEHLIFLSSPSCMANYSRRMVDPGARFEVVAEVLDAIR
jgi:methionine synthase I (cobalamin-dependent)